MSELRKYAGDALFYFPLVADGAADFVTDYVPAAGDAKIFTDKLISTNPTALILGFDSLSEIPAQGATIEEQGAGTAEGVVAFTVIITGTVGAGTAAGFFFLRSVTGQAWTNNDVIDINGGSTSIADADSTTYDLAATAGLIAEIGGGRFAACLSPTEMTCAQGEIYIIDSATKAIEDQAIQFHTYGNAAALHAIDLDDSVRAGLTALPNAAADAAGGLPISDAGGLDLDDIPLTAEFEARTIVAAGYFDPAVDPVAVVTNLTNLPSIPTDWLTAAGLAADAITEIQSGLATAAALADVPTVAEFNARTLVAAAYFDPSTDSVLISAAAVDLIWDELLTGGTHNDPTSAGRRLRELAESGTYSGGLVWLDTNVANTGSTSFTDGTDVNPTSLIAAVNTILAAVPLHGVHIASGSSVTFAASQQNQEWTGEGWVLALGGQSIAGSSFIDAVVSGVSLGVANVFRSCFLNASTFAGGDFIDCALGDTITLSAAVGYHFFNCHHAEMGAPSTIDFGAAVGATEVHLHNWHGSLIILNMKAGDILHFTCADGALTMDATCTGGTRNSYGNFVLTDNSSGMTVNDGVGSGVVPWNAAWDAEVESEVNDALVAIHLDHMFAVDYDPASPPGVATALFNELIESDAGVSRYTVNALENAPSGSGSSAAAIADAVWQEAQADHTDVGSFGEMATEIADIPTTAEFEARTILAASYFDPSADPVAVVTNLTNLPSIPVNWLTAAGTAADFTTEIQVGLATAVAVADVPTVAEFNARTLVAASYFDPAVDPVAVVTNLTNLPSIPVNWLTAAGTAADFTTEIQSGLATAAALAAVDAVVDSLNLGIIYGVAQTGTLSTTQATTDITGFLDNELVGRTIYFTVGGVADGQGSRISAYAAANGLVTYGLITTAPANNDPIKIV